MQYRTKCIKTRTDATNETQYFVKSSTEPTQPNKHKSARATFWARQNHFVNAHRHRTSKHTTTLARPPFWHHSTTTTPTTSFPSSRLLLLLLALHPPLQHAAHVLVFVCICTLCIIMLYFHFVSYFSIRSARARSGEKTRNKKKP